MYRQGSSASLRLRLSRECEGVAVVALAWQSWKGQTGRDSYAPQRACNKKGRGAATSGNRIEVRPGGFGISASEQRGG